MRIDKFPIAIVAVFFWILAWTVPADGQVIVWKAGQKQFSNTTLSGDQPSGSGESPESNERTIRVSPMSEPSPALKYRFWVSASLRQPGNVTPFFSRAVVLFLSHPSRKTLDRQYSKLSDQWIEQKVRDEALSSHLSQQREILDTIYEAAGMETIELYSTQRNKRGREVLTASFYEIQNLRDLARLVQLDGLLAIKERRYDHAIRAIEAGFRLAEFAQSSGDVTLLSGFVGVAISGITFSIAEELSQQADAPNLYWALASLPDMLWDQRDWLDGESVSMSRILYPLLEPSSATMTPSDWKNRLVVSAQVPMELGSGTSASATAGDESSASARAAAQLVVGAALLVFSDWARTELIDSSFDPDQVQHMSAAEAVARNTQLRFERYRDDLFKWSLLQPLGKSYSDAEWDKFRQQSMGAEFAEPSKVLIGLLIPALQAADGAALRCNMTHKQLMLHEALRAYAAAHGNKLPESLVALQPLPTLPNPETGELFQYERLSDSEAIVRRKPSYPKEKVVTRVILQSKK